MAALKRHWRAILGAFGTVYGLIRAAMDLVGDVDLILDHIPGHDTTWLGSLTAYLLTARFFFVFPVVIGSLALIYWDVKRPDLGFAKRLKAARLRAATTAPSPTPEYIPLPEAARRVLEANLGNLLGEAALRASDGDGDNKDMTYQWIGWWMAERMTIYGNRPPSIAPEPITYEEAKRYHMRGGAQQLWATSDRLVYDNLKVRDDELTAAWSRLMFKE